MSIAIILASAIIPEQELAAVALCSVTAVITSTDTDPACFAPQVYRDLIRRAVAAGFKDDDMLEMYRERRIWTTHAGHLASDIVHYVGGPEAVLDIFDLHTFDEANEEFKQ